MIVEKYHKKKLCQIDLRADGSLSIADRDTEPVFTDINPSDCRIYVYLTCPQRQSLVTSSFNVLKQAFIVSKYNPEDLGYHNNNVCSVSGNSVKLYKSALNETAKVSGRVLLGVILERINTVYCNNGIINSSTSNRQTGVPQQYDTYRMWQNETTQYQSNVSLMHRAISDYSSLSLDSSYVRILVEGFEALDRLSSTPDKDSREYLDALVKVRCLSFVGTCLTKEIPLSYDSSVYEVLLAYAAISFPDTVALVCIGNKDLATSMLGKGLARWRDVVCNKVFGYCLSDMPSLSSAVCYFNTAEDIKIPFDKWFSIFSEHVSQFLNVSSTTSRENGASQVSLDVDLRIPNRVSKDVFLNPQELNFSYTLRELRLLNSYLMSSLSIASTSNRCLISSDNSCSIYSEDLIGVELLALILNSKKESKIGRAFGAYSSAGQSIVTPSNSANDVKKLLADKYDLLINDVTYRSNGIDLKSRHIISNICNAFAMLEMCAVTDINTKEVNLLSELGISDSIDSLYEPGKARKAAIALHSNEIKTIEKVRSHLSTMFEETSTVAKGHCEDTRGMLASRALGSWSSSEISEKAYANRISRVVNIVKSLDITELLKTWRHSHSAADSLKSLTLVDSYKNYEAPYGLGSKLTKSKSGLMLYEMMVSKSGCPRPYTIDGTQELINKIKDDEFLTDKPIGLVSTLDECLTTLCAIVSLEDCIQRSYAGTRPEGVYRYSGSSSYTTRACFLSFSDTVFDLYIKSPGLWNTGENSSTYSGIDGKRSMHGLSNTDNLSAYPPDVLRIKDSLRDYRLSFSIGDSKGYIYLLDVLRTRVVMLLTIAQRIYTECGVQSIVVSSMSGYSTIQSIGNMSEDSKSGLLVLPKGNLSEFECDLFCIGVTSDVSKSINLKSKLPGNTLISDSTDFGVRFQTLGIVESLNLFDSREQLHELLVKSKCNVTDLQDMLIKSLAIYQSYYEDNYLALDHCEVAITKIKEMLI